MMQEIQPELMFILLGLRCQIFFQFEFIVVENFM